MTTQNVIYSISAPIKLILRITWVSLSLSDCRFSERERTMEEKLNSSETKGILPPNPYVPCQGIQ